MNKYRQATAHATAIPSIRSFAKALFLTFAISVALANSTVAMATRVWAEGNLATTFVGLDSDTRSPIRAKVMLTALGPDAINPYSQHDRFARCMKEALVEVVEARATWESLDLKVKPWFTIIEDLRKAGQPLNSQTLASAHASLTEAVASIILETKLRYEGNLAKCGLPSHLLATARLAIVNRVCLEAGGRECSGKDFFDNPDYSTASRYSKLFEWLRTAGLRRENAFLEIGPNAELTPVVVAHELYAGRSWPPPRSTEQMRAAFETGAVHLRQRKARYSYEVPALIELPREAGYRLVDVIAHPALAVPQLTASPGADPGLLTISDEIARLRIRECVLLRAARKPDEISSCAGYLLDARIVSDCMNGRRCVPAFNKEGSVAVLEHLAANPGGTVISSLPRIGTGDRKLPWDAYEKLASECKKLKQPAEATICMSRGALSADERNTLECARIVATKGGKTDATARCLVEAMPTGQQKEMAKCAASSPSNHKAMAVCASMSAASPELRSGLECMQRLGAGATRSVVLSCMQDSKMGDGRIARAVECLRKHPNDWAAAAVCLEAGESLPEGSDEAVKCANSADDYKKFAGCMAATKLFGDSVGGDGGRLVNCAAQSGGDGMGTLACMAGQDLTPEQQIALQCAAQSPDLVSFAGCTGGQLALREFIKCQGREFGDNVCFGPNNEIRKFLKAVGIDVRKDTLLGQIANAHLDFLKAQVGFAEAVGQDVVKVGEGLFRMVEGLGQAAGDLVSGIIGAGASVITGIRDLFGL